MKVIISGLNYRAMLDLDSKLGDKTWRDKTSAPFDERDYIVVTLNSECKIEIKSEDWVMIRYNNERVMLNQLAFDYLTVKGLVV